jgi:threonine dehydratase
MSRLKKQGASIKGVISATRGNHGQSIALAAAKTGIAATIVVPQGNSVEKNAAMRAFGAELIEAGHDFDAAREAALQLARERGLVMVPSFHRDLVCGVASYALELFRAAPALDTVYVPIGLGSGICGVIAMRDALSPATKVVGVVSTEAPAYALSFAAAKIVATNSASTMADGMAVRGPDAEALAVILKGADRIVEVSDAEIAVAMRAYYEDAHQLTEGAGAASLAALLQERERMKGKTVGLILSGGNIDRPLYLRLLGGG